MNALVIGLVIIALLGGFFTFFYRSMHISETLTYSLIAYTQKRRKQRS